jgi:hypothetical protein
MLGMAVLPTEPCGFAEVSFSAPKLGEETVETAETEGNEVLTKVGVKDEDGC